MCGVRYVSVVGTGGTVRFDGTVAAGVEEGGN